MLFTAAPMTDAAVAELSTWRYGGEYAIYDESSYEEKRAARSPLLDPEHQKRYTCFYAGRELVGYINLVKRSDAVFLGIALNPDWCGKGHGLPILRQGITLARSRWPSLPLRLEVRDWNRRAIRCYEKAGFRPAGRVTKVTPMGPGTFLVMEWDRRAAGKEQTPGRP